MPASPYVTPQSLVDEFGERELIELTDKGTPRTYAVDTALLQRACDRAGADIDAAVGARYRLPLVPVPELLPHLGRDLARFYLYEIEPPTVVQTRFDAARKTLRDIASGAQPLAIADTGGSVADLPEFNVGQKAFARSESW